MHDDEVDTDVDLVGRLVADQFPLWADLPIRPVPSSGTDNARPTRPSRAAVRGRSRTAGIEGVARMPRRASPPLRCALVPLCGIKARQS